MSDGRNDMYAGVDFELTARVERLERKLADMERAQFIGPIQEFKRMSFDDALRRIYENKVKP